ncbi:MAG: hypothetical protein M1281_07665 [Chloroflexi bacterium]|nr:hypothetical protein [Chloroflexota bacterium]
MAPLTRAQCLTGLETGWGTYVERFRRLSPPEQAAWLKQQGYTRLADLLGHVIAWWEQAIPDIECKIADPGFQSPDVDVDTFNARAVQRFSAFDEAAVIRLFEAQRRAMLDLVLRLPERAFGDKNLRDRLHIEIIGHLEEHEIA